MDSNKRRWLQGCAAAAAGLCAPAWVRAQQEGEGAPRPARPFRPAAPAGPTAVPAGAAAAWPQRAVRLLVGFPAGASPDLAARAIAEPLGRLLRHPVVVENKPGASGNVAAELVAKSTDDHTIGALINGNLTIAKLLNPKTPFDPETDFAPVGLVGTAPLVWAVAGDAQGSTPAELLLWARNLGERAWYGTPGNGTVGHLGMELIKTRIRIGAQQKTFPGNPQVIAAMLAGQVQMALLPPGLAMPHVQAGRLKAIGVTSPEPSPLVPELPTLHSADVRSADLEIWTALAGPASLPRHAVAQLNAALGEVLRMPALAQTLLRAGWQASPGSPDALASRMRRDTRQLGGVILMRGIRADA